MRRDGHDEELIARGLAFVRAFHAAARRAAPYAEVAATTLDPARGTPWGDYFGPLGAEDWPFFVRNEQHPYDPVAALERITCPILALFGERDILVPAARSAQEFERALARAGNRDVTIRVFPEADHRIRVGDPPQFAPGYLDLMGAWLRQRAGRG